MPWKSGQIEICTYKYKYKDFVYLLIPVYGSVEYLFFNKSTVCFLLLGLSFVQPPSRDSGYNEWDSDTWGSQPRRRSSSISSSSAMGSRRPYNTSPSDVSAQSTLTRPRNNNGFHSPPPAQQRNNNGFHSPPPAQQRNNGFFGRGMMQSNSVSDLQNMGMQQPQQLPPFHPMQSVSYAHLLQKKQHNWNKNNSLFLIIILEF